VNAAPGRPLRQPGASRVLALFLVCILTGCASIPPEVRDYGAGAVPVALPGTPFYPQQRFQCGPAALMTILAASGVQADLDDLTGRVYLQGIEGSLQAELIAQTRAAGRMPYRIDGRLSALVAELGAGRPVLVLQNLGVAWWPRWHYAVVVGVDSERDEIVLRSGTERRRITATRVFLNTWRRSGYWGFVALKPGELPANPDDGRYFASLSALEETGHRDAAWRGWQAAAARWPASRVALFGLANSEFLRDDWRAAERAYRQVLELDPALAMARNNLALSLLRQDRHAAARREAQQALALAAGDSTLENEIAATLAEIDAAAQ